jgi:hypothetical protein
MSRRRSLLDRTAVVPDEVDDDLEKTFIRNKLRKNSLKVNKFLN